MNRQSILIVDDNPINIEVLGSALEDEFEVIVATSGKKALDITNSTNPPDLILLDIMMPEMDGYEVCKRIKSNVKTQSIPVIFVSAKGEVEDEAYGLEIGGVDYLRKPFNPAIALARIKTQIELKGYQNRLEKRLAKSELARERHQKYFHNLFNNSPQAIAFVDQENKIININPRFEILFGYKSTEAIADKLDDLVVPQENFNENSHFFRSVLQGEPLTVETTSRNKKGERIPVSMMGYPVRIDEDYRGVFVIFEDISERKAFEEQLRYQAFHDALTGIPNRVLLMERIDRALARSKRIASYQFAVLLIDLDRFKSINDSLGHLAGDELLKTISNRIVNSIRDMDTVARLGGDEFAVLIEDLNDTDELTVIIKRVQKNIERPVQIGENTVHISSSIGVVIKTDRYDSTVEVLRDADLAMYHAKEQGKANFKFFDDQLYTQALVSHRLESDLRTAIAKGELYLLYQPIVSVRTGDLEGFEALVRWHHPYYGLISPDRFIPLAEETGLIVTIGQWIFNQACRQLKQWQNEYPGFSDMKMNINISVKQFLNDDFVSDIDRILKNLDLRPETIKLELTESLLMEHSEFAAEKISELKALGIQFVIDDFGTGYSSLSYIHQFPVDVLKIDRSFIHNMETGSESIEIVKTILALSTSLNLTVVAEGVENDFQLNSLKAMNCHKAQGYLFSKPLSVDQASQILLKDVN